jgi:hypothetical protein
MPAAEAVASIAFSARLKAGTDTKPHQLRNAASAGGTATGAREPQIQRVTIHESAMIFWRG